MPNSNRGSITTSSSYKSENNIQPQTSNDSIFHLNPKFFSLNQLLHHQAKSKIFTNNQILNRYFNTPKVNIIKDIIKTRNKLYAQRMTLKTKGRSISNKLFTRRGQRSQINNSIKEQNKLLNYYLKKPNSNNLTKLKKESDLKKQIFGLRYDIKKNPNNINISKKKRDLLYKWLEIKNPQMMSSNLQFKMSHKPNPNYKLNQHMILKTPKNISKELESINWTDLDPKSPENDFFNALANDSEPQYYNAENN